MVLIMVHPFETVNNYEQLVFALFPSYSEEQVDINPSGTSFKGNEFGLISSAFKPNEIVFQLYIQLRPKMLTLTLEMSGRVSPKSGLDAIGPGHGTCHNPKL